MKPIQLLIGAALMLSLAQCKKSADNTPAAAPNCDMTAVEAINNAKVTINAGAWGTISSMSGNCMPTIGPGSTCKHCPAALKVRFYDYTLRSQAVQSQPYSSFYSSFSTTLRAEVQADNEGFYQVPLPPGTYTMVVLENGLIYGNSFDSQGGINPVQVSAGRTKLNLMTTYNAVF